MSFDIGSYWENKGAITVPQCTSDDSKCGLYAIGIAVLCPGGKDHPARITKKLKEHIQKYNGSFQGNFVDDYIDDRMEKRKRKFKMAAKDIVKFEKLNPELRIYVLGACTDEESYTTLKECSNPNVTLMLFQNPEGVCHWTVVRNLDRLIFSSESGKSKKKKLVCANCRCVSQSSI